MKNKHATENLEKEIIELSKTKSQKEISKIYNRSQSGIQLILKRNNIKQKKCRLNMSHLALDVDYFKEINSNDKAYWLGYICADGNINKLNNKVSLFSSELNVIENFKEAICAEHAISKKIVYLKQTNKTYTGYSIQIGNEIFTQNLINLGVTSNKTDSLEFPKIDEKYYSYFIAGLFDGDGSAYWCGKTKNNLYVNLISTKEILNFIKEYLNLKPKHFYRITLNKINVWKMFLYSDSEIFLKFIYSDRKFKYYLTRKYNLFQKKYHYYNDECNFNK